MGNHDILIFTGQFISRCDGGIRLRQMRVVLIENKHMFYIQFIFFSTTMAKFKDFQVLFSKTFKFKHFQGLENAFFNLSTYKDFQGSVRTMCMNIFITSGLSPHPTLPWSQVCELYKPTIFNPYHSKY